MQRTALIGEIKRASPSKGNFLPEGTVFDPAEQACRYAYAGAAAISVLTEPTWFKGTLDDMLSVRKKIDKMGSMRPAVLRKDFVFDEYQRVPVAPPRPRQGSPARMVVRMLLAIICNRARMNLGGKGLWRGHATVDSCCARRRHASQTHRRRTSTR